MMQNIRPKRLASNLTISDCSSEIFCIKFSPDDNYLAAGYGDGIIRIFNAYNGNLAYTLAEPNLSSIGLPCTSIKWRPLSNNSTKTRNVLLVANSCGTIEHWHISSGKCLNTIDCLDNQLYTLEYRSDGEQFAAAGKNHNIKIYDENTKKEICCMETTIRSNKRGHSNRIFSLKYNPIDENILLSGGWDNTIQIWDIRIGESIKTIYGPHIAGDSLDMNNNNEILTGSWRADNPLEIWDYNTTERKYVIPWNTVSGRKSDITACFLYAASFSSDYRLIAAGGSGSNEAKVFDHKNGDTLIGTIAGLSRGIFTLDFNTKGDKLAIAGADTSIRIIDIYDYNESAKERPITPSIKNAPLPTDSNDIEYHGTSSPNEAFPPSPTKVSSLHP